MKKPLKELMADLSVAYPDILEYQIGEKSISFHCSGLDENNCIYKNNNAIGELFNAFLLELSEGKKVFFQGYRLFGEETKVIEPDVILKKAKMLQNPSHIFLYLKSAKVSSLDFYRSCEGSIYYFDSEVEWADFLVSWPIRHPVKLIEEGRLSALFSYGEFGGDFYFRCNKTYESRILQLFEELSVLGYKVRSSSIGLR